MAETAVGTSNRELPPNLAVGYVISAIGAHSGLSFNRKILDIVLMRRRLPQGMRMGHVLVRACRDA